MNFSCILVEPSLRVKNEIWAKPHNISVKESFLRSKKFGWRKSLIFGTL